MIPAAIPPEGPEVVPDILERSPPHYRPHLNGNLRAASLDDTLRRLARQEACCRRVLGRLAAAFLLKRAHQALGFVRIQDYARERLGVSGRELQELARVARGLERLPRIAAAFDEGMLSYSHVRLLVSVATPDTEARWLAMARTRTVRALQAAITEAGRSPQADDISPDDASIDGEPRTRFHLRCPRRARRLWKHVTELASRMSGAHLPAWRAAEAIAAEGLAGIEGRSIASTTEQLASEPPVSAPPAADPSGHGAAPGADPSALGWEAVRGAMPEDVERLAYFADSLNPHRLDERLRAAVTILQRIDWQTGRVLRLASEVRLYRAFGFISLEDYVHERLGCSLRRARALIALDRKAEANPELLAAYRDGRLSLARALTLMPVVGAETTDAWVARAQQVTVRRLVDMVDWALEVQEPGHSLPPPPAEAARTLPPLDAALALPPLDPVQMRARGLDGEVTFHGPESVVGLLWAAIRTYTPPGESAWRGFEALLVHAKTEWERQPRHRDPIFERDGWRCAVPACTARSSLQDHHVVYRSRGGDNSRDNRVAICAAHHLHGIHGFKIRVTGRAPDDLTWELGFRRARPPLLRTHGDRYLHEPMGPPPPG